MSRKERETTLERAYEIFDQSTYATVSLIDEENKPYAVMISPIRIKEDIYFHCGLEGKKIDCLSSHSDVCVSAVANMQVVPQKFSVDYASCILVGKASIVEDRTEKKEALYQICNRFSKDYMLHIDERLEKSLSSVHIVKIHITTITGKENPILRG